MNRKSLNIAALSLLTVAIASCTADEDIRTLETGALDNNAIVFSVDNTTAARSASSRDMNTTVTGFKVSALDRGAEYFGTPMSVFSSGSSWTSTSKTYWPTDRALTFVAYVDSKSDSFKINDGVATFADYEVPTNVSEQSDLMYAVAKDVSKGSSNGNVKLRFRHSLSQISFTAQNNSPVYESIEILSVELGGVKGNGTYTFPQGSTSADAKGQWTIASDATDRSFTMGDLEVTLGACNASCKGEKVSLSNASRAENGNVMYMIPQSVGEGSYIKVKSRKTLKDVGASYESEDIIPISGEWKEGQCYNYNIAWNATPITFNVKVADFREVSASVND